MNASFTPSNSPYNSVLLRTVFVILCCVGGTTENAETAAVVDVKTIAVVVPFMVEITDMDIL